MNVRKMVSSAGEAVNYWLGQLLSHVVSQSLQRRPESSPPVSREFLLEKPGEVNSAFGKDYVAAFARSVP